MAWSTDSLLASHPHLLVGIFAVTQLYLPHLESVVAAICTPGKDVKGPIVLGTCDASAEDNAEVLDIKEVALRQGK